MKQKIYSEENNFGPASPEEKILFGASRPGYKTCAYGPVDDRTVQEWIDFMIERNIGCVCCLLGDDQLAYYGEKGSLISRYVSSFGAANVLHSPVEDYRIIKKEQLFNEIFPFILNAEKAGVKVVVHCSAGQGRTGQVLFSWLVKHRGMDPDKALSTVNHLGRNPLEAFSGTGTGARLAELLLGAF
jgi:protein-tyrosine phosphatase